MTEYLPDLAALLPSWQLALRSEGKAPGTVKTYSDGVTGFLRWAGTSSTPPQITKPTVQAWIADLLDGGAESATAIARFKGVRQFAKWLTVEGELDADPLLGMNRPKDDRKLVPALTDEELRTLIDACRGKTLKDRRDEAIVRFLAETGVRAGELLALSVADVDLNRGLAVVHRGTGGEGRVVPFGPQTGAALDRYIRIARRELRFTDGGPLWVGAGGRTFAYHGLHEALKARAAAAGIAAFHAHRLRHTAATRWLRAGGSEQGLMAVAGWSTRAMLDRYTGASASERAAAEARSLDLGAI
jgi:integrase